MNITLSSGQKIYTKIQFVNSDLPWIIHIHGLGEHHSRHDYLSELCSKEVNLFQFDLIGHGRSEGERGFVQSFSEYRRSLNDIIIYLTENYGLKSYHLVGHSMGSLIACDYYKHVGRKGGKRPERIFLSAPPVGLHGAGGLIRRSPHIVSKILKELPFEFDIDGDDDYLRYSNDPSVLEEMRLDPLMNIDTSSKLVFELIDRSQEVFGQKIEFHCPVWVIVGSLDRVVRHLDCVEYFGSLKNVEKIVVVPGGHHELYRETPEFAKTYFSLVKQFISSAIKMDSTSIKSYSFRQRSLKVV